MAIDPLTGELLYMGGSAYDGGDEWDANQGTWLWSGSTWTRVADNPVQGGWPALAVDQATGQLLANCPSIIERGGVAVGGSGSGTSTMPAWYAPPSFNAWTATGWAAVPAQPPGDQDADDPGSNLAFGAAVAYDPISHRVIQFGGSQQDSSDTTLAYNGSTWVTLDAPMTSAQSAGQPPAGWASAATDESADQIIMLAQQAGGGELLPTTWTWTGSAWSQLQVPEPPGAALPWFGSGGQLVWDPALNKVILVYPDKSGDIQVWVWGGTSSGWEQVPS